MKVYFDNRVFELTDRTIDTGQEQAIFDEYNFVTPQRTIRIADGQGLYTQFAPDGVFYGGYRNKNIEITDDNGNTLYSGLIQDIEEKDSEQGRIIDIITTDVLGAVMPYFVNAVDQDTYSGFLVNGAHGAGSRSIIVDTGTTSIPDNAVISFDDNYLPSYRVVSASDSGGATKTIELDRGIEAALTDNQAVYVSVPQEDTPANLMLEALQTAFAIIGQENRIDTDSFNAASLQQTGYNLWVFIRPESGITLGQYLGAISQASETFIRQNEEGKIECVYRWQWDGYDPGYTITDSEIIAGSLEKYIYRENILYRTNALYHSSGTVKQYINTVLDSDPALAEFLPTKVWQPFQPKSTFLYDYNILFADLASATYYADEKLNYWKYGRERFKFSLKPYFSGTLSRIPILQFSNFLLDLTINGNYSLASEPVKVVSLEKNNDSVYDTVIVERINYPTPGLTKP